MKKTLITVLVTVLVCCTAFGATYAWLMDKTTTITNTFTFGDVSITLEETKGEGNDTAKTFKMVPGATIDKDPKVSVVADSEACWLFVKIDEANNTFVIEGSTVKFINYTVESAWTEVEAGTGVYYIKVDADTAKAGKTYSVLTDDVVTVNDKATVADFTTAGTNYPQITFTAYAVQADGFSAAAAAWAQASTLG